MQDAARLHVIGLLDPDVQHERIFAFAGPFNWTDVIHIFRKLRPHLIDSIPDPPKNELRDLCEVKGSRRAEQLLKKWFDGQGFKSMEECLAEGIGDIP